jgi:hypothetical protein
MASRSRIEMNRIFFRRLIEVAASREVEIQNATSARWLKTSSLSDRDFMAKAEVLQTLQLNRNQKSALISYNDIKYLALVGFDEAKEVPEGMVPAEISTGVFSVTISALEVDSNATGSEIREALELNYRTVNGSYKGHEIGDILPLFPSIAIYELSADYVYTNDLSRCIGLFMVQCRREWALDMTADLLSKMRMLFERGSDFIPYHNLVHGIVSLTWPSFYLEVYRCIERLYLFPCHLSVLQEGC